MVEVYQNLFVGDQNDGLGVMHDGAIDWYIIHACKEPFHRDALGYSTRGAPKSHPEYLIARRENRLILNLIDAPRPEFIPSQIMEAAVEAIHTNLERPVLVHCNQGISRSPTIALLFLLQHTQVFDGQAFEEALLKFKVLHPAYNPGGGMFGYLQRWWKENTRK